MPPRKLPKAGPGDVKASRNRFSLLADGESGGDDDDVSIDEPSEPVRKRSATKAKATPKGNGKGKGRGKGKAAADPSGDDELEDGEQAPEEKPVKKYAPKRTSKAKEVVAVVSSDDDAMDFGDAPASSRPVKKAAATSAKKAAATRAKKAPVKKPTTKRNSKVKEEEADVPRDDDDAMDIDEAPPPSKTSNAAQRLFNVRELAHIVYTDMLNLEKSDAELDAILITLDPETGALHKTPMAARGFQKVDAIQQDGIAKVFGLSISCIQERFVEFLRENAGRMVFSFTYPSSLDNFADMLRAYLTTEDGQHEIPITVAISLFFDMSRFGVMRPWEDLGIAHGYKQKADKHVKRWMDAIGSLPGGVKLIIILPKPWLDYRSLRVLTAGIRESDRISAIEVAVQTDLWEDLPGMDFHLAMTVSSILGSKSKLAEELSDEDYVEALIKHGCRGFRGNVD